MLIKKTIKLINKKILLFVYFKKFLLIIILFLDQRNLGMSMKIERSSLDQVKKRFESNKKKMEEKKKDYDLEQRLRELKEEVIE